MTMRVQSPASGLPTSSTQVRAGWIIGGLVSLFLLADGIMRFLKVDQYVEGTLDVGFPESQARWIGLTLVVSTVLYLVPRVSILGAILLTGYLGGAIAAQVRIEEFGPIAFAAALGVLVWVGLALRDGRIRALMD